MLGGEGISHLLELWARKGQDPGGRRNDSEGGWIVSHGFRRKVNAVLYMMAAGSIILVWILTWMAGMRLGLWYELAYVAFILPACCWLVAAQVNVLRFRADLFDWGFRVRRGFRPPASVLWSQVRSFRFSRWKGFVATCADGSQVGFFLDLDGLGRLREHLRRFVAPEIAGWVVQSLPDAPKDSSGSDLFRRS